MKYVQWIQLSVSQITEHHLGDKIPNITVHQLHCNLSIRLGSLEEFSFSDVVSKPSLKPFPSEEMEDYFWNGLMLMIQISKKETQHSSTSLFRQDQIFDIYLEENAKKLLADLTAYISRWRKSEELIRKEMSYDKEDIPF